MIEEVGSEIGFLVGGIEPVLSKDGPGRESAAVAASRREFERVLEHWASDLLSLRASGLDVPGRRRVVDGVSVELVERAAQGRGSSG